MRGQQALDLVVGIPALLVGIAEMPDGSARTRGSVLILGADPGEVDGLARPGDGDDLAEAPLRPFRWIVALDVQVLRQRRPLSGNGCRHDDDEGGPRTVGKGAERAVPTRIRASHWLSSAAARRWRNDLGALPLPAWGEGWGEGVTEPSRDLNPSPTPLPMGEGADRACCPVDDQAS